MIAAYLVMIQYTHCPTLAAPSTADIARFRAEHNIRPDYEELEVQQLSHGFFSELGVETVDIPVYSVVGQNERARDGNGIRFRRGHTAHGEPYMVVLDRQSQDIQEITMRRLDGSLMQILPIMGQEWFAVVPWNAYDSGDMPSFSKAIDWVEPLDDGYDRQLQESGPCSSLTVIEVAIEYDFTFCAEFGFDAQQAEDEIERILAVSSFMFYEIEDLCFRLELSHLDGFCDPQDDPYNAMYNSPESNFGNSGCEVAGVGMLWLMGPFWVAHRKEVTADIVHLFQGRAFTDNGSTVACAFIGVVCNPLYGYAVNGMFWGSGSNPLTRVVVFTHELGHNCGALHAPVDHSAIYVMEPFVSTGEDGFSDDSKSVLKQRTEGRVCVEQIAVPRRPSQAPSSTQSGEPSMSSASPSILPSNIPSEYPSMNPSQAPSWEPSQLPSLISDTPSIRPTIVASGQPSAGKLLSLSSSPSRRPSQSPSTITSHFPTGSRGPSVVPSVSSEAPSSIPTPLTSAEPSAETSTFPTSAPSLQPSETASAIPSSHPSELRSQEPTNTPSRSPEAPSSIPTSFVSAEPSAETSTFPTSAPSLGPSKTSSATPSYRPSELRSQEPTSSSSRSPPEFPSVLFVSSEAPSSTPTSLVSAESSGETAPSLQPSETSSAIPSYSPSEQRSDEPTSSSSILPSEFPSRTPTMQPSAAFSSKETSPSYTDVPSRVPSTFPSMLSAKQSLFPTGLPSAGFTMLHSRAPSLQPSNVPSGNSVTDVSSPEEENLCGFWCMVWNTITGFLRVFMS